MLVVQLWSYFHKSSHLHRTDFFSCMELHIMMATYSNFGPWFFPPSRTSSNLPLMTGSGTMPKWSHLFLNPCKSLSVESSSSYFLSFLGAPFDIIYSIYITYILLLIKNPNRILRSTHPSSEAVACWMWFFSFSYAGSSSFVTSEGPPVFEDISAQREDEYLPLIFSWVFFFSSFWLRLLLRTSHQNLIHPIHHLDTKWPPHRINHRCFS